jgi:hypothetical protein
MGLFGRSTAEGARALLRVRERMMEALEAPPAFPRHDLSFSIRADPAFPLGASVDVRLPRGKRRRWLIEGGWSSCGGSPAIMIAQAATIRALAERACVAEAIAGEHKAEWSDAEVKMARELLEESIKLRATVSAEALESEADREHRLSDPAVEPS